MAHENALAANARLYHAAFGDGVQQRDRFLEEEF